MVRYFADEGLTMSSIHSDHIVGKREVGKLLIEDREIDLERVRAGYDWHNKRYIREQGPSTEKTTAKLK